MADLIIPDFLKKVKEAAEGSSEEKATPMPAMPGVPGLVGKDGKPLVHVPGIVDSNGKPIAPRPDGDFLYDPSGKPMYVAESGDLDISLIMKLIDEDVNAELKEIERKHRRIFSNYIHNHSTEILSENEDLDERVSNYAAFHHKAAKDVSLDREAAMAEAMENYFRGTNGNMLAKGYKDAKSLGFMDDVFFGVCSGFINQEQSHYLEQVFRKKVGDVPATRKESFVVGLLGMIGVSTDEVNMKMLIPRYDKLALRITRAQQEWRKSVVGIAYRND